MYLGVHPMPLIFFIKITKFLMRLDVSSKGTAAKCYVFILHEAFIPVNDKYYS